MIGAYDRGLQTLNRGAENDGEERAERFSEEPVLVVAGSALRPAPSATDEPLLVFGVTLPLDRDPGERDFNRAQVLAGELNGDRPQVLVQAF
jgi:hypothetical protein